MQRSASDPRGVRNQQPPGGLQGTGCRLRKDVVFLADHTKLGQKASFFFAQISDLTCVITDTKADKTILSDLARSGVEVIDA